MTMTQKILAKYSGRDVVWPGEFIQCKPSVILGNDITTPVAINVLEKLGTKRLHDSNKVVLVMDHFTPNKDIKSAQLCQEVRNFATEFNIKNYFDVGTAGIEHALLPEQGIVTSGDCIIGADSHTCTYGALGSFSTGVGSTDMAIAMASGLTWLKVPSAVKIELTGHPKQWVSGKDIILNIIGTLGEHGALYKSIEFCGEGLRYINMDDRFCMANMVVEAGAKNGIFPVDNITKDYTSIHTTKPTLEFTPDENAEYDSTYKIDLSSINQTVALPYSPQNICDAAKLSKIYINQVVIGSCTNGRISDLRVAANILKNKKIAKNVRCIIIPATQQIYLQAIKEGLAEIFIKSGAIISPPTCGPCLGGHMGILADGEKAVCTTNRNFRGRMGHINSEVYLASPAVAANSAIHGYIKEVQ